MESPISRSACGVLAVVVIIAFAAGELGKRIGDNRAVPLAMAAGAVLVALAVTAPVARGSVIGTENVEVSRIAPIVNDFVRARPDEVPTIQIASRDTWPVAVGVVLYLVKRGTPVAVDDEWLNVVGRSLRQSLGSHPRIVFGDETIADTLARRGFVALASNDHVRVLFGPVQ